MPLVPGRRDLAGHVRVTTRTHPVKVCRDRAGLVLGHVQAHPDPELLRAASEAGHPVQAHLDPVRPALVRPVPGPLVPVHLAQIRG